MKDIEKLILALIIVSGIIIILLIRINSNNDTTNTLNEVEIIEEEEIVEENISHTLQIVKDRSDFFAVEGCISKFYTYYSDCFSTDSLSNQGIKAVYNMLDKKYIEENEITEKNIIKKLSKINNAKANIHEMYVDEKSENIYVYIAKGKLREKDTNNILDFELMLMLDMQNKTFTVFLKDYIDKYYNELELGKEIDIEVPDKIEENDYNIYDYKVIDDEEYVRKLIARYKEEIFYDKESAYNHLDQEYREKRFENFSDFETYLKANTKKNVILKLAQYRKTIYDDYKEYVCIDTKGNYYIFKEKSVMNYGMILDTYTVNLPDFIKKYDGQNEVQKVASNINKLVMAINEQDYKYVYNKLNTTYKNTYFTDYNTFETFLTKEFYDLNELGIEGSEKVGQKTYTVNLKITDTNNVENVKECTIIVRLKENRDYEISFGIQ